MNNFTDTELNRHVDTLSRYLGGQIIPLHEFHAKYWIEYGLITQDTLDFFREFPYSEYQTSEYKITIRRVDDLINLRIYQVLL